MQPIWGGASLVFMHLRAMKDLVEFKSTQEWNWDYVINLSEADFPLKYLSYFKQRLKIFIKNQLFAFLSK